MLIAARKLLNDRVVPFSDEHSIPLSQMLGDGSAEDSSASRKLSSLAFELGLQMRMFQLAKDAGTRQTDRYEIVVPVTEGELHGFHSDKRHRIAALPAGVRRQTR
ncbi:hypothetical protein MPL3356_340149 [Mesorhizobium plurifarium]|uniref:Uncharacterized protein n=1 Tax=Mesorhizobium plurifarium TaxID=69974 RepID=A0A090E1S1_MESPL|nr:hypothetical protein MPL3356_340149 [Mesorhizobium plurifarium]